MPPSLIPKAEIWPVCRDYRPGLSRLLFVFTFGVYVMYISIFLQMLMQKENWCPYISAFPHTEPQ
jgi:hypothetical protein